ncbi:hypothetical protein ACJDU8_14315 [Clostridium sp. WILCCON 0269]|uniref:Uncharacterized protein n=1 Tax=Candidatus Clostridium eludens TaxID=3381663 RepID=A0ABW8SL28_9CLOT
MNKIKVLYDVFNTLKEKEVFNGVVKLEAVKGKTKIISFVNEFLKNNTNGEAKVKTNSEINIDGNTAKCDSSREFNMKDFSNHNFCDAHHYHHGMHHMQGHGHNFHHGLKSKLDKITFMFSILNNLKAEEKDAKSILTIDLKEILKEVKDMKAKFHKDLGKDGLDEFHKKFHKEHEHEHHKYHKLIKELLSSEYKDAALNIIINKNNEVEKVEITANGETNVNASVNFVW